MTTLSDRLAHLADDDFAACLDLVVGDMRAYAALAEHHYRGRRPATVARVLALRHHRPSLAGAFYQRPSARESVTAAVLVESMPVLNCRLRLCALGDRYRQWPDARQRAALIKRELRCISRVIVHPQWRGVGLAARLVSCALATATTTYTEALAAMGRVHPFFERAGMTAYRRPPLPADARLRAALQHAGLDIRTLVTLDRAVGHINALPAGDRHWLLGEIRSWHRKNDGRARHPHADLPAQLTAARTRLLCDPVYYLHDNRQPTKPQIIAD